VVLLARGERCVCDIEGALGLPQNLTSHHLAVLKREGLLSDRRHGKWIYYRLATQVLSEHAAALTALLDPRHAHEPAEPCADDATP
jgi:ArsR family transcriptional regulator